MNSMIKNIGLSVIVVGMMSGCGTDDVVDAVTDALDLQASISGDTYSASQATAYLEGEYVAIVKYVNEDKLTAAAIVAKTEYDVDNIIRVETSYTCASLGLDLVSSEQEDGATLLYYATGNKYCYQFDYPESSSNYGSAHAAYSTNNTLDF